LCSVINPFNNVSGDRKKGIKKGDKIKIKPKVEKGWKINREKNKRRRNIRKKIKEKGGKWKRYIGLRTVSV